VNIVAIETATETVGVAVRTEQGLQAELTLTGRRRHTETLTPALEHLLGQVGLPVGKLDVVVVDVGPGLFTGLRVGVAAAKGLAQALGIGVIGLSSLEILLRAAAGAGHRDRVLAAVDARRGEVFAAVRAIESARAEGPELVGASLFQPEMLASTLTGLAGHPILAVGDGAQRYAAVLETVPGLSCVTEWLGFPPPSTMLDMAADDELAPVEPQLIVPHYMREADATSNFAQANRG
jgi:tRNA threonylcarbamoyladenosine biosynthesis protein TsaB